MVRCYCVGKGFWVRRLLALNLRPNEECRSLRKWANSNLLTFAAGGYDSF